LRFRRFFYSKSWKENEGEREQDYLLIMPNEETLLLLFSLAPSLSRSLALSFSMALSKEEKCRRDDLLI